MSDPTLDALDFDAPTPTDVVDFRDRFLFLAGEIEHHVIMACRLFDQAVELRAELLANVVPCDSLTGVFAAEEVYLYAAVHDAMVFGFTAFKDALRNVH